MGGVRTRDASALLSMLAEARELSPRVAPHGHLLERLAALVGADVVGILELSAGPTGVTVARSVDVGWTSAAAYTRMTSFYGAHGVGANPFAEAIMASGDTTRTARREELVDDHTWYGSAFVQEVNEPCGLDHSVYSLVRSERGLSGLGLSRARGGRPFDDEDLAAVDVFHSALLPLVEPERAVPVELSRLTRREREVFDQLLTGRGDKEIASGLELSRYTVSQHVRAVLRKLVVSTRAELIARYAGRMPPRSIA